MRRTAMVIAALAAILAACSSGSSSSSKPITLKVWTVWSGEEGKAFQAVIDRYTQAHKNIKVEVTPSAGDDTKFVAAVRAGNAPDVVATYHDEDVGKFCTDATLQDLSNFEKDSHVTATLFPKAGQRIFDFRGKHCALPYGANAYALYYNTDLLRAAGYTAPPKTISELVDMSKKLTQFNGNGSIKVAGFVPTVGFYEAYPGALASTYPITYFDKDGKANLSRDSSWHDFFTWDKALFDFYGKAKLTTFTATLGQEFTPDNGFETGKLAMNIDGEWRTRLLATEHPELHYATAPFPAPDNHPENYGAGSAAASLIGIPKGSAHPKEAWDLIKFLALDTHNVASFFSAIHNVPTTNAALKSKDFDGGPNFDVFMNVFANPRSTASAIIPEGAVYFDPITNFAEKWQTGGVADLDAGLRTLDAQIDAAVAQAHG
jgi:multiple sugar transport system substrate-binding protein